MKYISTIIYGFLCLTSLANIEANLKFAESELTKIENVLGDFNSYNPDEVKSVSKVLQNISYIANQDIISIESRNWAEPSKKRLEVIESWAEVITPYNDVLIEASFITSFDERMKKFAFEARSLLDFTNPDNVFINKLNSKIEDEENLNMILRASDLLFEHRSLSQQSKKIIAQKGDLYEGEKKLKWASKITNYGMLDGIDVLLEKLNKPIDYENFAQSFDEMEYSINATLALGNKSADLLPSFIKLCDDVIENVPAYKYNFINMKAIAQSDPKRKIAKNGSGYLDDEIKSYPLLVDKEHPKKLLPNQNEVNELRRPKEQESASSKTEKTTSFPWWLLGIVGLVVVLGFMLLKGKSK